MNKNFVFKLNSNKRKDFLLRIDANIIDEKFPNKSDIDIVEIMKNKIEKFLPEGEILHDIEYITETVN